jgi:hypothetical protein
VLDLNQRPKDSGLRGLPRSLDYLTTLVAAGVPHVRVPGARGTLIGSAPHVLVSAPSRLLTTPARGLPFGGLGSGSPCLATCGFPEFTRLSSAPFGAASPA